MNGQRGVTLVELMVSLAIVLLIVGMATLAYLKLLRSYKTHGALSESYMANLTGFELLRYDIEMAGFGLPASVTGFNYSEAAAKANNTPQPPYDPSALNDSAPLNPPRPFFLGSGAQTLAGNNSAVLSIKSTAAWINPTSGKWSTITNPAGAPLVAQGSNTFVAGENIITIDNTGALLHFNVQFDANGADYYNTSASAIASPSNQQVYYIYGIDPGNSGGVPAQASDRMPFNRVDYYLDNSPVTNGVATMPSWCAPNTYELYRATISQTDGKLTRSALIDCVEDFQVAFGVSPSSGNGIVWQNDLGTENIVSGGSSGTRMTPAQMQQFLREIRVFILYQEGRGKVSNTSDFTFSGTLNLGDQDIAHALAPATWTTVPNGFAQLSGAALSGSLSSFSPLTAGQRYLQYRWKIMEIDAKPMNMLNLQSTR